MRRKIENELIKWKHQQMRLPLLIRGARQVGKTYAVENFGKDHFEHLVLINLEQNPEYINCFNTLDPQNIIAKIEILKGKEIKIGKTLLFIDEIQESSNAVLALRYFKEQMPDLHVIGAGSLLEFILNDEKFRMPVGRIQFLHMFPMSFLEFIEALGYSKVIEYLEKVNLKNKIDNDIHEKCLELVRIYLSIGGMPEVVKSYIKTKSFIAAQRFQTAILETYRNDFGKYSKYTNYDLLKTIFDKVHKIIGLQVTYVGIDSSVQSRELKKAILALKSAGIITPVYHSKASGVPLGYQFNESRFKLLFLDVGLVQNACRLGIDIQMEKDLLQINRGAIAEQFVGQELIALQDNDRTPEIYYWHRDEKGSQAEVDYVINVGSKIFPVEVKSGKTGTLKSLLIFLSEKKRPFGIRISQQQLNIDKNVLSVPLYMIEQIPRLVEAI